MLVIFYGTSAELIKMLGIVKGVPRSQQLLICNSQQYAGLQKLHKQLDIEPDVYLSKGWRGKDVANMKQMLAMMLGSHGSFAKQFRKIKKQIKDHDKEFGTKSVAVVHGDTLTTVVGSYLGKALGLPVAHVEAGLRSGHWKSPFPEEIDRRIAAKFARIHFPPNAEAEVNLVKEKVKGDIVVTTYNTAKDAIQRSDEFKSDDLNQLKLPKKYCLVLLHRTELLESKTDLEAILKVLHAHASAKNPVVFTEHTTTKAKISAYGFDHYLDKVGFRTIPKQPYFDFMAIVKGADYIVTDGGGLQEDAFFLGIPTMVHRGRTERSEGLGLNADISRMDVAKVEAFLKDHKNKTDFAKMTDKMSPSKVVIDYFTDNGYIKGQTSRR